MAELDSHLWWQRGVIYQIYPRSFQDSNGDGVGDLRGIEQRLDYLEWLGVDAIWISPIFPSPMADFGYDVAHYQGIHPMFGTMGDFDRLLARCHERGIRLLLDLVPNHSSDQHAWFKESRSSRDNPKRDWYLWHDPAPDGGPPNNWLSVFGGPAWEFDEATGQYYYHAFLKEQPDLNWRNPDVREAIFDAMRFWFEKGVDGFRIDVLWHVIKDERWRDNPKNPDYDPSEVPYEQLLPVYSTDQPEALDIAEQMRAVADEFDECVLIGEVYLPIERLVAYYGRQDEGIHLPFNFQLLTLPWDAREIDRAINEYEGSLPAGGWPNWVLGNHDKSRIASRVGDAQARVAAVLLLTLRGTPTIYYGDELGLEDVSIPSDRIRDPQGLRISEEFSRDPQRTPMPWDSSTNAGFSDAEPWLPLNEDARKTNVATLRENADSMLTFYRRLLKLRRERPALSIGTYGPIQAEGNTIAYIREDGDDRIAVALNLGDETQSVNLGEHSGHLIGGTHSDALGKSVRGEIELRPNEAIIIDLDTTDSDRD
jgi:alpha-glucosidase